MWVLGFELSHVVMLLWQALDQTSYLPSRPSPFHPGPDLEVTSSLHPFLKTPHEANILFFI